MFFMILDYNCPPQHLLWSQTPTYPKLIGISVVGDIEIRTDPQLPEDLLLEVVASISSHPFLWADAS